MQSKDRWDLTINTELESALTDMARVDESDYSFLSCYLDARAGKQACKAFLNQKAAAIRASLRGIRRFDFENALGMIHRALDDSWHPEARGLAIFARGLAGGRHLTVLHFAAALDNRLVLYRVPELLPLVALLQREPAFTLLMAKGKQLLLTEVELGSVTPQVWVNEQLVASELDAVANGTVPGSSHGSFWRSRKALVESSLPLLIAGDSEALPGIADWLPTRAVTRLIGSISVPREANFNESLGIVRNRLAAIRSAEASRLAAALLEGDSQRDNAGLGYRATLEALSRGEADAVVIADWDHAGLGLPWEAKIELCRDALRRDIRVVLADSIRLCRAGGVGCLRRRPTERSATSSRINNAGFGLVA